MRPKIILITGLYPLVKGGAEYQMRIIADYLKYYYDVIYIYLGDVPGHYIDKTICEKIDGYKVYSLKSVSKIDNLFLKYFYSRRLLSILKKEKPDYVYQRVLKFMSFYLSKFQKKVGYRYYIHIADLFSINYNKSNLRDSFNLFFFRKTINNNPNFIVQTREQKSILQQYGVNPVLQVYNMHPYNEIDIEHISNQKKKSRYKHIVWVANIKPIKQLEILIKVAEKFKNNDFLVFDIIGNVQSEKYGTPLLNKMKDLSNIRHFTDKDNNFVNKHILEYATLVVNTSKSEGFSNVFIQSWLCGVPVLSLNSNPDTLFDLYPEFGIFCDNSISLFEESINNIIYDKSYNINACQCYHTAKKMFSVKNIELIKNILDTK